MAARWGLLLLLAAAARAWTTTGVGAAAGHPPLAASGGGKGSEGAREVLRLEDGTRIQVQEFYGASKLAALQHIWETVEVVVTCPQHQDYTVYTGTSMQELRDAYAAKTTAWCGLDHALGGSAACRAGISPFGTTYVAVAKPKGWFERAGGSALMGTEDTQHACTLERRAAFSMGSFLLSVLGTFLFWNAPGLSASTPFRLTGGTLGFMACSVLIFLFVLYRQLPHKRSLAVGTALFGSSLLGAVRYLFGTWLPSASQLARSPWVHAYLVLSGLLGLAVTYWFNNPHNRKFNNMLNVALHLVGLAMSAAGPSLWEASALWVAALLGARAYSCVQRYRSVGGAYREAKRAAAEFAAVGPAAGREEGAGGRFRAAPAGPAMAAQAAGKPQGRQLWAFGGGGKDRGKGAEPVGTPVLATARGGPAGDYIAAVEKRTPVAAAEPPAEPELSPLVQRGLVLNEETGHLIQIGKATYNRLVAAGYTVDRAAGVITPPPAGSHGASPSGASPSPRGSGRGGARRRRQSQ